MSKPVVKDRVYRHLLQKLANEEWLPGQELPSLRATGQELRVSHHPVHLVWQQAIQQKLVERRGRKTFVAEGATERARNLLAQSAAQAKSKRLAILISSHFHVPLSQATCPFQAKLADAVVSASRRAGYQADVISIYKTDQLSQASRIARSYDAAFVIGLSPQHLILMAYLAESGLPMLTFQRRIDGINIPSLSIDEFGAAKQVARQFVNEGHTNVTMVTPLYADVMLDPRLVAYEGWLEGLREAGIYDQCIMPLVFVGRHGTTQTVEKLVQLRPAITGLLFGVPPVLAHLAKKAPLFSRLAVPGDISIAAMSTLGRVPLPEHYPLITSFEVEWERVGACAIEMFDKMMAGRARPKNIRIPLRLQRAESIGPPPSGAGR